MTAYHDRHLAGHYNPKPATVSLDGREVAKTVTHSRKRAKSATKKTSS